MSMAEKIAGIQKMFEEELIFKDAELVNMRKLTVTKLDEKRVVCFFQIRNSFCC